MPIGEYFINGLSVGRTGWPLCGLLQWLQSCSCSVGVQTRMVQLYLINIILETHVMVVQ